ncbi:hypothetical protein KZP23_22965 [Echinicola marina]|uniref:methylmalonyl-CoA mutase family protein n=1 Tax=Echinicola marina TaxID=2859768 RepID=UPI001CF62F9D|nr:methylmalonyl-CoA mutase family protein [Echinicola marina]UCS93465.1 hypothetical protein KZP23_22965 [Echinicola marina]
MIDLSFYGFPCSDRKEWIAQAIREAGMRSEEDFVIKDKIEGLNILPFFTLDEHNEKYQIGEGQTKMSRGHGWGNVSSFDLDRESHKDLLDTLNLGIDGLILKWSGEGDIAEKLIGLNPQHVHLWLAPKKDGIAVLKAFLHWAKDQPQEAIKGGFLWDPMEEMLCEGREDPELFDKLEEINQLTSQYPQFRGICIDMGIYLDSGGNTAQQLSFGMIGLSEVLKNLCIGGIDIARVFNNVMVKAAVGGDYFLNIAKLKLIRVFADQIAKLYGASYSVEQMIIFAHSALWTKSHHDQYTNMVRNTIESLMAINGNSDQLFVGKSDLSQEFPDVSSKRLTANISNLLKLESHLDTIGNPSGGAFYLDFLLDRLFDKVKEKLIELEEKGGWLACFNSGKIQDEIKLTRNLQVEALRDKDQIMVGVNAYKEEDIGDGFGFGEDWEESKLQLRRIPKSVLYHKLNISSK